LRGYLLAVDDYPADDVERAIDQLVKGTAPGINPSFRPKPSETGAECRRQMNLRLDRERDRRPKLAPPDVERSPEAQARVRELVERTVKGLRTADADDPQARHRRQIEKANAMFDAERGYSVGDMDAQDDAA